MLSAHAVRERCGFSKTSIVKTGFYDKSALMGALLSDVGALNDLMLFDRVQF